MSTDLNPNALTWLIEDYMIDGAADKLAQIVRDQGHQAVVIREYPENNFSSVLCQLSSFTNVVFKGSLQTAKYLRQHKNFKFDWNPGVIYTESQFKYSVYSSYFQKYLCNPNMLLMPYGVACQNRDYLFDLFKTDRLFIRPDSGNKQFTGQIIEIQSFETEMAPNRYDPEMLVCIGPKKTIAAEFRFFCAEDKVLSGCLYRIDGTYVPVGLAHPAAQFAQQVLTEVQWKPDTLFVMDVANVFDQQDRIQHAIVELNSFSCSDLYACDPIPIIQAVQELTDELLPASIAD